MNFSHGSYEYHQSVIDNTRKMVARKLRCVIRTTGVDWLYTEDPQGRPVAIALDTVSFWTTLTRPGIDNHVERSWDSHRSDERGKRCMLHPSAKIAHLNDPISGLLPPVTSLWFQPTQNTAKSVMTRLCGLIMYAYLFLVLLSGGLKFLSRPIFLKSQHLEN